MCLGTTIRQGACPKFCEGAALIGQILCEGEIMASTSYRELDKFPGDLAHATWYTASWYPAKVTEHNGWQVAAPRDRLWGGGGSATTPSDLTSPEYLPGE